LAAELTPTYEVVVCPSASSAQVYAVKKSIFEKKNEPEVQREFFDKQNIFHNKIAFSFFKGGKYEVVQYYTYTYNM
jgi:hypothetical protein